MNCYVYVIVRQCILYCISFELPCILCIMYIHQLNLFSIIQEAASVGVIVLIELNIVICLVNDLYRYQFLLPISKSIISKKLSSFQI